MPKDGEGYPLDIKGQMICIGSIVSVPIAFGFANEVKQSLGYVRKITQKRGIDVVVFHSLTEKESIRFIRPSQQINVIPITLLKERDDLHELIRMSAGTIV